MRSSPYSIWAVVAVVFVSGLIIGLRYLALQESRNLPLNSNHPAPDVPIAGHQKSLGEGRIGTNSSSGNLHVLSAQTQQSSHTSSLTVSQEQKEAILSRLSQAACSYQATSLPLIEPYLYSADQSLRDAAVNAVMTLGDASGGAVLRKAASADTTPAEAADLLQKAAYLELPPASLPIRARPPVMKRTNGG